jgi:hypothetical protein
VCRCRRLPHDPAGRGRRCRSPSAVSSAVGRFRRARFSAMLARHTAVHFLGGGGIRRAQLHRFDGAQLAVQVGGADAHHGTFIGQHIGRAQQAALPYQAGDVARHGGTRQAQFDRQVLLGDEGVGADQLVKLFFFRGVGHGSALIITIVLHDKHLSLRGQQRAERRAAAKFTVIYNTPDLYGFV